VNPPDPTPTPPDEALTDFGVGHAPKPGPPPGAAVTELSRACQGSLTSLPGSESGREGTLDEPVEEEDVAEFDDLSDEDAAGLADWKSRLRYDFERWLSAVDEVPLIREAALEPDEPQDLYAFFEQLAVLNTESRRSNRRTAEALSQWSEALVRFGGELDRVRELATQSLSRGGTERLPRTHCLSLVEVLDRLQRLTAAFAQTPPRPWFGGDRAWRRAWENQRQAFLIVADHLEAILRREGVTRLETLGKTFDPHQMTAVAVEATRHQPPQTVLEETAHGYLWNGELLRAAQVKIAVPLPNP